MKKLVLGGVKSGKTAFAENSAKEWSDDVCVIATAQAFDDEMKRRIEAHKAARPSGWKVIEEPLQLADVIRRCEAEVVLIDCLTLWVTNLLMLDDEARMESEIQALLNLVAEYRGKLIFVSNENSFGVTPPDPLTRKFLDRSGMLHQKLAKLVDEVVLVVAGMPLRVK